MTTPHTTPKPVRPDWLIPVIVTVVTGLLAIVLVAMNGLYWMCAAIAVLEAISITMMIKSSRVRAAARNSAASDPARP
jgi:ABC-type transport system involved in cytochrome bd biosynthesis fused ATPase/permease subunit